MSLAIFFHVDVTDRLTALAQANDRALALAQRFGADPELARLARDVYAGALADVGAAFGLALRSGVSHSDHAIPLVLAQVGKDRLVPIRKRTQRPEKD